MNFGTLPARFGSVGAPNDNKLADDDIARRRMKRRTQGVKEGRKDGRKDQGRRDQGRRGGSKGGAPLLKSRYPHLAGGEEKHCQSRRTSLRLMNAKGVSL